MHMYIRTYIHTYLHTYIHKYTNACTQHALVRAHTHTTNTHTCRHAYIHTYIHTYVHTYIRTYIHTYIHTYIFNKRHVFVSVKIETYYMYIVHISFVRLRLPRDFLHIERAVRPIHHLTFQETVFVWILQTKLVNIDQLLIKIGMVVCEGYLFQGVH